MVINTNNINKTNNHLSPKESLNSDGHQYQQYQQNEQFFLILTELTQHTKNPQHMTLEIQVSISKPDILDLWWILVCKLKQYEHHLAKIFFFFLYAFTRG